MTGTVLHFAVDEAFDRLLTAWREHHRLTTDDSVSVQRRADARLQLDRARTRMHHLRTAVYPEATELEGIVDSVWCETLEVVVHLRWADRDVRYPGRWRCVCGHGVAIDWDRAQPGE